MENNKAAKSVSTLEVGSKENAVEMVLELNKAEEASKRHVRTLSRKIGARIATPNDSKERTEPKESVVLSALGEGIMRVAAIGGAQLGEMESLASGGEEKTS